VQADQVHEPIAGALEIERISRHPRLLSFDVTMLGAQGARWAGSSRIRAQLAVEAIRKEGCRGRE